MNELDEIPACNHNSRPPYLVLNTILHDMCDIIKQLSPKRSAK